MKKSGKILVGAIIALAFIIGYFVGVMVDFPPVEKSKLAGTIGKIDNYRNVKVSENDINLRSELMNNKQMLSDFQRYYSFHYTNNVQKSAVIDESLASCKAVAEFAGSNQEKIDALDRYNKFLAESRKDILIALIALRKLSDGSGEQRIGIPLNNANNAIAQISYRGTAVLDIVEALDDFITERPQGSFPELKKAHDQLLLNQIRTTVATNDKLMMKYLDKKEFFGSQQDLSYYVGLTEDAVQYYVVGDMGSIGSADVAGSVIGNLPDAQNLVILDVYQDITQDISSIGIFSNVQGSSYVFDAGAVGTNIVGNITDIAPDAYGIIEPL